MESHKTHHQVSRITYMTSNKKCTPRLNTLCALTGTGFGQHKETLHLYINHMCVRFNQFRVASRLHHKPHTPDSLTSSPNTPTHTSTLTLQVYPYKKTGSKHNIRYSTPRNTPLRSNCTTSGPSTPQQTLLRAPPCVGHIPQ